MTSDFDPIVFACSELLNNFPPASKTKNYIDNRLSKETQEKFQFGYFPVNEHLSILQNMVGKDILFKDKCNLIYDKVIDNRKERHGVLEEHNLILPYKDLYGNIIGLVGRTIQSDEEREISGLAKYKNTSFDKGKNLFGLDLARKSMIEKKFVYIVEGQIDLIRAQESGISNIVALGSSNMTFEQVALILRYCDKIVLLLDNDEAGIKGAAKIKDYFDNDIKINIGKLPNGYKDMCEMIDGGAGVDGIEIMV